MLTTPRDAAASVLRQTKNQADLRITEIFLSLQGEARASGLPSVFVRLTGCPLRCHYCDTAYAFSGGEKMSLGSIVEQVRGHGAGNVCVTGGEPLAQPAASGLIRQLCDEGYDVAVETSGALDIDRADRRASRIMDLKTPDSGECHRNDYSNIERLTSNDQVKFVICSRGDFDWACQQVREHDIATRCPVWFSPSFGSQNPTELADWIIQSRMPVRMQLQLHKQLWGDEPGR